MTVALNCPIDPKAGNRNLPVKETSQCLNCRIFFESKNGCSILFCSFDCEKAWQEYTQARKEEDQKSFRDWIQLGF